MPLKLCWAITMNKSQGLTLPWINSGMQERSVGLSYVAISRVKSLKNLIVDPLIIARLSSNFQLRYVKHARLNQLCKNTLEVNE